MSTEKYIKFLNQITCSWCGKEIQGFYRFRIHARICPKRIKKEWECPRCLAFKTWDVVELYKHQLQCIPSREYLKNAYPDDTNEHLDLVEEILENQKKFVKTNGLVVCMCCGFSAKDLVDLAKHYKKECEKKPKGFTYGMDLNLLRRMLMPTLPLSDNFIHNVNPDQVEKIVKADLKTMGNEYKDKISAILNNLSKCKKCGEELEGAMDICSFCGEEIYQVVEYVQNIIKLAKNLLEEHLERVWKFALIADMEDWIDSIVRYFEHVIMLVFKGVGEN